MTYVETIEQRLTPPRSVAPAGTAEVLAEWCRDLNAELAGRLELVSQEELDWQPHPDSNSVGATAWHVARWLDVLGTRAFTGAPASEDLWHCSGLSDATGYEPDGIGYRGLGTLTGYTPEEMRAVPCLDGPTLKEYLGQASRLLVRQISELGDRLLDIPGSGLSPYQQIAMTLQGSFGHTGEIDTLMSLRARLAVAGVSREPQHPPHALSATRDGAGLSGIVKGEGSGDGGT